MRVVGPITPVVQAAARHELVDFVSREPALEETFLAEYGHEPPAAAACPMTSDDRRHSRPPSPLRSRDLRPRQRLRQDDARLAPCHAHRRRRHRPAADRRRRPAIVASSRRPRRAQEIGDIVDAVPPILQGLAGKPVNVETLGGYLQYKYGDVLPARRRPVVDPRAVRDARRRGAPRQPRHRGRRADHAGGGSRSRRSPATSSMMTIAMLVRRSSRSPIAGSAFAALPGDEISRRRRASRTRSGSACMALVAGAAGLRARAVRRPRGGGGHRRRGHVRRLHPQRLPGGDPAARALRQPDLVRLDVEPHPARRPLRLAVARAGGVVAVVLLAIGVEAFVRRDLGATTAIPTPACRTRCSGSAGRWGAPAASGCPRPSRWGIGLGLFGLVIASSRPRRSSMQLAKSPQFLQAMDRLFPGTDVASVGGFLELVFIEFGLDARRARRGGARRRLGIGRDVRPRRDAARHAAAAIAVGRSRGRSRC